MNFLTIFKKNLVLIVLLVIAAFYFIFYQLFVNGSFPIGDFQGYYMWYDQSRYLLMAKELSQLKLINYDYGLGYPILAVPFVFLLPKDPFLIPNFIIWLVCLTLFFKICQKIFNDSVYPVICSLFYIFGSNLIQYVAIPWNSTVVLLANMIIAYLGVIGKRNFKNSLIVCLLLIWIFSARYVDLVFSGIFSLLYFWPIIEKRNYRHLLTAFIILCLGVSFILFTHELKFGSYFKTPYAHHMDPEGKISDQDLSKYQLKYIPSDLKGILFGTKEFSYFPSLLGASFYFVFIPFGILIGFFNKHKRFIFLSSVAMTLAMLFYASFPHFSLAGLKVGAIHYIKAWLPFMVIYFILFIRFVVNLSINVKKK